MFFIFNLEEIDSNSDKILYYDRTNLNYIDTFKIYFKNTNSYIDAFWKILPQWWPTLNTFRITGGEPLLSKHTWSMFDFVDQHANKNLNFAVNSNLSVPDDKIDLFIV